MDNMFPQFSISGESLKRLTIVDPFLNCPDLRIIYQKGTTQGTTPLYTLFLTFSLIYVRYYHRTHKTKPCMDVEISTLARLLRMVPQRRFCGLVFKLAVLRFPLRSAWTVTCSTVRRTVSLYGHALSCSNRFSIFWD